MQRELREKKSIRAHLKHARDHIVISEDVGDQMVIIVLMKIRKVVKSVLSTSESLLRTKVYAMKKPDKDILKMMTIENKNEKDVNNERKLDSLSQGYRTTHEKSKKHIKNMNNLSRETERGILICFFFYCYEIYVTIRYLFITSTPIEGSLLRPL